MSEFYRAVHRACSAEVKHAKNSEAAIRAYCVESGSRWNLQIRGPRELANYRLGKSFMVATATLGRDDLVALRDALDALLEDAPDCDYGCGRPATTTDGVGNHVCDECIADAGKPVCELAD